MQIVQNSAADTMEVQRRPALALATAHHLNDDGVTPLKIRSTLASLPDSYGIFFSDTRKAMAKIVSQRITLIRDIDRIRKTLAEINNADPHVRALADPKDILTSWQDGAGSLADLYDVDESNNPLVPTVRSAI